MQMQTHQRAHPSSNYPLAIHVIPSSRTMKGQITELETTMQSLLLGKRYPIALELAGTATRRSFIVRATTQAALDHVETLLRSLYQQIDVRPLDECDDPFRLDEGETVSAVELINKNQHADTKVSTEGTDPLLGLLGVFTKLPAHTRAVMQISLVPIRRYPGKVGTMVTQTSKQFLRSNNNPLLGDSGALIAINIVLLALVHSLIPAWIFATLIAVLSAQTPQLSQTQIQQLVLYASGFLCTEALIFWVVDILRRIFVPPVDPKMIYRTHIRLYAIGPRASDASLADEQHLTQVRRDLLLRMSSAYKQFHSTHQTSYRIRPLAPWTAQRLLSHEHWKYGHGWHANLNLSPHYMRADVLATLWHLPPAHLLPELAAVEHRRARSLPISPAVADLCRHLPPIGYSQHGGQNVPFGFSSQFFAHNTIITGKAGDGKRAFLQQVAHGAMRQGGLVLIDPYGDLYEHVLPVVPPERAEDVVLIDLADSAHAIGLNPLDVTLGRGRDKTIADLLKLLAHIWASNWGSRMENAFEMSLRTLFEANKCLVEQQKLTGPSYQYTLLDVLPLLTNVNFCHALLQDIQDDYLHRWWREYYEPLSLSQQRDVINPVITRVSKFESTIARRVIGQGVSTINFAQMILDGKIVLVKLAKGIVGAEVAALIGATILGVIQITLEEQGLKGLQGQRRLPIIIDEFHLLSGAGYRTLTELHNYGATFFLATQSLQYLQRAHTTLLPTIMANTKQMAVFHLSALDAELIQKEIEVEQQDILHLDLQTCYLTLLQDNQRQPTFSVRMRPAEAGDVFLAESIRTRCRVRYTRPVEEIDDLLRDALLHSIRSIPAPKHNQEQKDGAPPAPPSQPDQPGETFREHISATAAMGRERHGEERIPGEEVVAGRHFDEEPYEYEEVVEGELIDEQEEEERARRERREYGEEYDDDDEDNLHHKPKRARNLD